MSKYTLKHLEKYPEEEKSFQEYFKSNVSKNEIRAIKALAKKFLDFLQKDSTKKEIKKVHKLNSKSGEIQNILLPIANELIFTSEKKNLFKNYRIRPDYYLKTKHGGIIIEVERGKTLANNMDLLNMWKCHICAEADYLFLFVPKLRESLKGQRRFVFSAVCKRVESFFIRENYINVKGVIVFGY